MKRIIACLLVLTLALTSAAQETDPKQPLTRADYLKKSKEQKTAGFVFLGIGAALIGIAAPGNVSFDILPALVIGGGAAILTSIIFFASSAKNKKRAMRMTGSLELQKLPSLTQSNLSLQNAPALSVKINF